MKKLTYLLLCVFCIFYGKNAKAQSFSLPSASASSMTRYVGTSINESSGRVVKSIPVYSYQAGNLSIPIGLTYVGNGVKVDQQSNWTGTNWNLEYGGVVTRTLNHLADEKSTNRLTSSDIASLTNSSNGAYVNDLIEGINQEDDLRPDIFSFTFPGYSGRFYFDNLGQPRLMNASTELKIEFLPSLTNGNIKNRIVITTMSGIEYHFGGDNASESTSFVLQESAKEDGVAIPDFTNITSTITAFYLFKIKHPFGDEILFDYHDDGDKILPLYFSESFDAIGGDLSNQCISVTELEETYSYNKINKQIYWGKISNNKKIKRIYSQNSDSEIRFNSQQFDLAPVETNYYTSTPQYNDRRLNSIHVYNKKLSEITKQVKLSYLETPYRFFLEEVEMNNESNVNSSFKCSKYKMEYDDVVSLPHRFSFSQDKLGYYNGKNNYSSIPGTSNPYYSNYNHLFADKSSVFHFAKKGSLTKMYYPSGGHTLFEYESPEVTIFNPINISLFANKNQESFLVPNKYVTATNIKTAHEQDISINVNVQLTDLSIPFQNQKVTISITDLDNLSTGNTTTKILTLVPGVSIYNETINFTIEKNKRYELKLLLDPSFDTPSETPYIASVTTSYKKIIQHPASGFRVEKISDFSNDNDSKPLVKKYYYKRAKSVFGSSSDIDIESAVLSYAIPEAEQSLSASICCSVTPNDSKFNYLSFRSDPFSSHFSSSDSEFSYKYVTVSLGGDLFEEGGIETEFKYERSIEPEVITTPFYGFVTKDFKSPIEDSVFFSGGYFDNNSLFNGTILNQTHYTRGNLSDPGFSMIYSELCKVKETNYAYTLEDLNTTEGLILTPTDNLCLTVYSGFSSLAKYNVKSYDFKLTKINSKEYIYKGEIPQSESTDFVGTEEIIEYESFKGLPTKRSTINSDGDVVISKNYYLNPVGLAYTNSVKPLTQEEALAYQELINQYRLSTPILTETYIKKDNGVEELRSRNRILFKAFNGMILPKVIELSKLNGPLEKRTSYTNYDNNGFLLETSSDNNVTSSVIYGYKDKKIIAQLVNISYDTIDASVLANIQNLSNGVVDQVSMDALELALDNLRTLYPQAQISTYVYNRLGQLSSMKDIRGYKTSYKYDECYRLKQVKDHLGNILKENKYNIKNN